MKWSTLVLIGIVACVTTPSHALLVGVYASAGDSLSWDEAAGLVAQVRDNHAVPTGGRYAVRTSDSSHLTSEFSVPEGTQAYFWSDAPYEHDGFEMRGSRAVFESGIERLPVVDAVTDSSGTVGIAPPATWNGRAGLSDARLQGRRLSLTYAVGAAGLVSVEAFGLNGRSYGGWTWEEKAAGPRERRLDLDRAPVGALYLRWTHRWIGGSAQDLRRLQ